MSGIAPSEGYLISSYVELQPLLMTIAIGRAEKA